MSKKQVPYGKLRGVDLLLGESNSSDDNKSSSELAIDKIVKPSSQPRRFFDPETLEQLKISIQQHGILEPLLVRPISDDKYELIAGERRYRAALDLKLTTVPVSIKKLTDIEAKQIALIENLQRVDLNPVEETQGILELLSIQLNQGVEEIISLLYRMHNEDKNKVTHNVVGKNESEQVKSVFQDLGLIAWQSFVTHRLPLLKLPEDILTTLREGKIAYTKAIALSKIKHEQLREELTQEAIKNNLSFREIKARIKELTEEEKETVEQKIDVTVKQIKKKKLWKNEPKKWKKVEQLLEKINILLDE
ncbi:ParB/RepB/Spo0J family partition protein (plasmid) [Cyanobacterium sp. IPPAS B-1200]|uniref:ParB/RepB/Spo0J family partition protein n=1 Tax=Cyanobacterium sp. IPPAS B-1200 TaxID=1562720 RepID=UPI0008525A35|nr:ParB/RepB/Spo0J family partition protein [Cyanobacterium sp. IPPAS B-1200]OEJ80053.1 chromosome partitioning protein ParB [Cyanobacterium sp. IPPAS B-1200]